MCAAWVSATDGLVIWNDDEVSRGCFRLGGARECRSREGHDIVVRSRAREVATILHVCPSGVRLFEEGPAGIIDILKLHIVEVVHGNLI